MFDYRAAYMVYYFILLIYKTPRFLLVGGIFACVGPSVELPGFEAASTQEQASATHFAIRIPLTHRFAAFTSTSTAIASVPLWRRWYKVFQKTQRWSF